MQCPKNNNVLYVLLFFLCLFQEFGMELVTQKPSVT